MKTATYNLVGGGTKTIEYDDTAPCICCGEPVVEASMGGTVLCPWCDMGKCRYCGIQMPAMYKEELDGGRSIRHWREHMQWHKKHLAQPDSAIKLNT